MSDTLKAATCSFIPSTWGAQSQSQRKKMQIHSFYLLSSSSSSSSSSLSALFIPPFSLKSPKPHKKPFILLSSNPKNSNSNSSNLKREPEPLELLSKPHPIPLSEPERPPEELGEALAPFLKFFKSQDLSDSDREEPDNAQLKIPKFDPIQEEPITGNSPELGGVKYYEPTRGDLVVGVVVSGNENKLDVSVGADLLGTMLKKEALPLYDKELDYLLCDLGEEKEVEEFTTKGKMGIVRDEEALRREKVEGRPVVEVGTVIFAEVLGRTLSGRPLLSSRRMYRRVAWHRVRQVLGSHSLYQCAILFPG